MDLTTAQISWREEHRNFTRGDLELFNLLERPIWIFDIEKKSMWWANTAAVALWNADSLEALLSRDFASDMSESTTKRLNYFLDRFRVGETFSEQVSFHASADSFFLITASWPQQVHIGSNGPLIFRLPLLNAISGLIIHMVSR